MNDCKRNDENPVPDSNSLTHDEILLPVSEEHQHHVPNDFKISFISILGNILEWYDFAVFGFFSDVIADNFFAPPSTPDSDAPLIETFVVFGLAYVARPFGGAIIGRMSDLYGRKGAVEASIFLIAISTFLMGCLPTYSMVGGFSTALLILLRFLQGLSVGGQFTSSIVFLLERKPVGTRGFWGSTVSAAASIGATIGSIFAAVLRASLTQEQLETWGWRIPFWFGIVGALPAMYLRLQAEEQIIVPSSKIQNKNIPAAATDIHNHDEEEEEEMECIVNKNIDKMKTDPLKATFGKSNRRAFVAGLLISTLGSASYYMIFVWMAIFMSSLIDPPIPHAFTINTINEVLGGIVFILLGGYFADWVGNYTKVVAVTSFLLAVSFPVALHLMGTGFGSNHDEYVGVIAFFIQLYLGILIGIWYGGVTPWSFSIFPPEIRSTSLSIGSNISASIWGGFTPLLATILVDKVSATAVGYLMSFAAMLTLIALWIAPKERFSTVKVFERETASNHVSIGDGEDGYEPLL